MKTNSWKKFRLKTEFIFVLFAALIVAFYFLFFMKIYGQIIRFEMKSSFDGICDLDLDDLDDDAMDSLDEIESKRIEVLIRDESLEVVYYSHSLVTVRNPKDAQNVEDYTAFEETLQIGTKGKKQLRYYWGKAKIIQNGEVYYVFLKKEVRSAGEIIKFTAIYFLIALILLFLIMKYCSGREKSSRAGRPILEAGSAERMNHAEKEFLANVSHELKTPLAIISEQLEMLQIQDDRINKAAYLASVREEVDHMSEIIGNLLSLTRVEHGAEQMKMSDVDLTDLLEYVVMKYSSLMVQKKIQAEVELLPKCTVFGNRMYLEQAFNNYMINAIQYTPQGMCLKIQTIEEKDSIYIGVYNDGTTIPDTIRDKIWDSFYSKSEDRADEYHNSGLGLYIVKNIVSHHKGTCGFENQEKGVEFWIRLPRK